MNGSTSSFYQTGEERRRQLQYERSRNNYETPREEYNYPPTPPSDYSYLWIGLATVLAIVGFSLSISNRVQLNQQDYFTLKTQLANPSNPSDLALITCNNATPGTVSAEYDDATYVNDLCPRSEDDCSFWFCAEDGYCDQDFTTNSTCWKSAQCADGFRCDLTTCGCVEMDTTCETDEECGIFAGNSCLISTCESGQCVTNLTMGSECSSTSDCTSNQICNSMCACENITNSLNVETYTPTFYNFTQGGFLNPFDLFPPSFLFASWIDFGEWVKVDVEITAETYDGLSMVGIFFDFDLPVPGDITENGAGAATISRRSGIIDDSDFAASGYVYIQTSTTGRVFMNTVNSNYNGTTSGPDLYDGSFYLMYKKAVV